MEPAVNDAASRRITPPRGPARRWVNLVLGFMVGTAVGLAPFLGTAPVSLFRPLLGLFPESMRDTLITVTSFLMGLAAVAVQFYAEGPVRVRTRRRLFKTLLLTTLVVFAALVATYSMAVVRIRLPDETSIPFVVGLSGTPTGAKCAKACQGLEPYDCITSVLVADEVVVSACYGSEARLASVVLQFLYVASMVSFAAIVGVMVSTPRRGDRSRA